MNVLLDTHAFLWFAEGDDKLPNNTRILIEDSSNQCFVSIASFWEVTIKQQIGKLNLKFPLKALFDLSLDNEIEILDISYTHLYELSKLMKIHSDPFDRIIISQAIAEQFTLITKDEVIKSYPIPVRMYKELILTKKT